MDIAVQRADDLDRRALERIGLLVGRGSPVRALDVAGGQGGQAVRMAEAGAQLAVNADIADYERETLALAQRRGVRERVVFHRADMRSLRAHLPPPSLAPLMSLSASVPSTTSPTMRRARPCPNRPLKKPPETARADGSM